MNLRAMPGGLCEACRHSREIVNDRGSRFLLCDRNKIDPRYPKYPRLPVLRCTGFEQKQDDSVASADGEGGIT